MKTDAHYYGVLAFSRACGFTKQHAWDVAYASQYVDDAKINQIAVSGKPSASVQTHMKPIKDQLTFFDMATCHSYEKVKTFNYSSMINNTVAFHFVPGCDGPNFPKKMRCRERGGAGAILDEMLAEMMARGNLFELGIVLHAYADTYSHQGFSGLLSKVNDIKDCEIKNRSGRILDTLPVAARWLKIKFFELIDEVIPAYGHAQALSYPDLPYLCWAFSYDPTDDFDEKCEPSSTIKNADRFRAAFKSIREILEKFLERHPGYRDPSVRFDNFAVLYDSLVAKKSDRKRIKLWIDTMKSQKLFAEDDPMLSYNENQWLKSAFANFNKKQFSHRSVEDAILANQFEQSKWFSFYKAVRWYKSRFFYHCRQAGVDIPR
jgi:hypothetical protein